jgi:hypothetical protein
LAPLWQIDAKPWHVICELDGRGIRIEFGKQKPKSCESRRRYVMKFTMDMSNYEIEDETMEAEYGDEILLSGWNPEIDTACEQLQLQLVQAAEQPAIPAVITMEVAPEVVEPFLKK